MPTIDSAQWMQKVTNIVLKQSELILQREAALLNEEIERCHACRGSRRCSRHQQRTDKVNSLTAEITELVNLVTRGG